MTVFDDLNREVSRLFPPTRHEVFRSGMRGKGDDGEWSVIVQPRGEGDLSKLFQLAGTLNVAVRIGGQTPDGKPPTTREGAVRVDMTGMDRVIELDEESQVIRVQAGISIAVLDSRLAERKLITGWTKYTSEPHTLGAVLSGVVPVRWGVRYGRATDAVRSMTVALPCGGVLTSAPAPRRATGPDLGKLFLGTRGKLGIISDVSLRVYPWPEVQRVLTGTAGLDVLPRLRQLLNEGPSPHLLEVDVDSKGNANVSASYHGTGGEVDTAYHAFVARVDSNVNAWPGLQETPRPSGPSLTMTWPAFECFCAAWRRGKRRTPFRVFEITGHSLRVEGGGGAPRRAALTELGEWSRQEQGSGLLDLQGVKQALDPRNLLGDVSL
jgi:FAD/FMN-containing dehydrogenase